MAKIITGRFSRSSSGNSELSDEQKEADKASIAQKQEENKADLSAMGSRFERDSSGSRPFSAEQQAVFPVISISEATSTTTDTVPKLSSFLVVDVPLTRDRKPPLSADEDGKKRRGAPKSSRYGKKKKTYSNVFGSFTAFNLAMRKAGRSIEMQTKRNENESRNSGKKNNVQKFTGKW